MTSTQPSRIFVANSAGQVEARPTPFQVDRSRPTSALGFDMDDVLGMLRSRPRSSSF